MRRCRVLVAHEREPTDDPSFRGLGNDNHRVTRPALRPDGPPLVGDGAPAAGREQPALWLRADGARQLDQRRSVTGCGLTDPESGHVPASA